ncbi:MAG: class I SAM-dependent methyltransferase [Chloroflexi bacterium]|nr:MAG: class I SAM-dependent methyltransferase [Chloroflexota bacterium]
MQYQERFSETHGAEMYDAASRELKAAKVIAILEDALGDLRSLRLLDLGCSNGLMTRFYGERFKSVIGIDFDQPGIEYAIANNRSPNIEYRVGDAMATGLPGGSVDVVTCTHVYEHVPDAMRMMDEVYRVLRTGGACLFIAGNRLTLMEADNHLPLLSLLPRPVAHRYVRLMRKGDRYYERTRTIWGLRRLAGRFELHDYTLRVVEDPVRFQATDVVAPGSSQQRIALLALRRAYWLAPTYIWLLRKKGHAEPGPTVAPTTNSTGGPDA